MNNIKISFLVTVIAYIIVFGTLYGHQPEAIESTKPIITTKTILSYYNKEDIVYKKPHNIISIPNTVAQKKINKHYDVQNDKKTQTKEYIFSENNGMIPGFCTYYVAHRAKRAFPKLEKDIYYKSLEGDAIDRYADAKKKGFIVSNKPSLDSIVVFGERDGEYGYAGHVAYVEDIDRQNKKIRVSDMNYTGLRKLTKRRIQMNDDMTTQTQSKQKILGFIPKQQLPKKLSESITKIHSS